MKNHSIYIVMGVSGSGKSTVARLLAESEGGIWLDADDFHPAENKAKMTAGIPLTDQDREPWLDVLNLKLKQEIAQDKPLFLACSALKQKYRDRLMKELTDVRVVYLKGSFELIQSRLENRSNHFMPSSLLTSQFAALEEPQNAIVLDMTKSKTELVEDFKEQMRSWPGGR